MTIPVHDGRRFSWSRLRRTGVCDASDFEGPITGRVWNDARDTGFYVRSHRTQKLLLFVADRQHDAWGEDGIEVSAYVTQDSSIEPIRIFIVND